MSIENQRLLRQRRLAWQNPQNDNPTQTMKLTPAKYWIYKFSQGNSLVQALLSESEIRQIQADAIRKSFERLRSEPDIALALNWMEDQANQLHPLREEVSTNESNPSTYACTCPSVDCKVHGLKPGSASGGW